MDVYTNLIGYFTIELIEGFVQNYCNYLILNNKLQLFCTKPSLRQMRWLNEDEGAFTPLTVKASLR